MNPTSPAVKRLTDLLLEVVAKDKTAVEELTALIPGYQAPVGMLDLHRRIEEALIECCPITKPGKDSRTFRSEEIALYIADDGETFSCLHCGARPARGDVLLCSTRSGRKAVWIVQSITAPSRDIKVEGATQGIALPCGYLEDCGFEIPPSPQKGFIL